MKTLKIGSILKHPKGETEFIITGINSKEGTATWEGTNGNYPGSVSEIDYLLETYEIINEGDTEMQNTKEVFINGKKRTIKWVYDFEAERQSFTDDTGIRYLLSHNAFNSLTNGMVITTPRNQFMPVPV